MANNATLATNLANGATFTRNVNLNGANAAFNAVQAGTNTINSVISGAGVFNQNGTGTTILGNVNTYTGNTTVNAGILEVDGSIYGCHHGQHAWHVARHRDHQRSTGQQCVHRPSRFQFGWPRQPRSTSTAITLKAAAAIS